VVAIGALGVANAGEVGPVVRVAEEQGATRQEEHGGQDKKTHTWRLPGKSVRPTRVALKRCRYRLQWVSGVPGMTRLPSAAAVPRRSQATGVTPGYTRSSSMTPRVVSGEVEGSAPT
jgi:hypothetical protein